jgi:hypothetical protein
MLHRQSELVQLKLNIEPSDGDSTPPEASEEPPLIEVGVIRFWIYRGTQNNPICFTHLRNAFIYDIILDNTLTILIFKAGITGNATPHRLSRSLQQFSFNTLFVQFGKYSLDNNGCIAVFSGTPIYGYYLHPSSPLYWLDKYLLIIVFQDMRITLLPMTVVTRTNS